MEVNVFMNILNLIAQFKQSAPEFLSSYCVINGAIMKLEEVENMGYEEYSLRSILNMPLKLYRYYPNKDIIKDKQEINYSIQALKNNTVYLQTPLEFDDVYDSEVNIEFYEYEHYRLIEYCKRCGIVVDERKSTKEIEDILVRKLWDYYVENGNLDNVFAEKSESEMEKLANKVFSLKVCNELRKTNDFGIAVAKVLSDEYSEYILKLKTTFRTVCFATTPYSQLMWGGAYADFHRGFCLEYTILPNDEKYKDVYYNLFPMIYCSLRPNMASRIAAVKDKEWTMEDLWGIYFHGALRKSLDWAFQNEWRLLLPKNDKQDDYNIEFFPITKVFLGNRMPNTKRKEIIEICNERNIPYIGVKRNANVFGMSDCDIKCEDCYRYNKI